MLYKAGYSDIAARVYLNLSTQSPQIQVIFRNSTFIYKIDILRF